MNKPQPITDMSSLQREKDRLLMRIEQKEEDLRQTGLYWKKNFRTIVWEYMNPFEGNPLVEQLSGLAKGAILPALTSLNIDEIREGKIKGDQSIASVAAILALRLIKRLFKGKKTEKDEEIE